MAAPDIDDLVEDISIQPKFRPTEGFEKVAGVEIAGWGNHKLGLEVAGQLIGWMPRRSKKIKVPGTDTFKVFYYVMVKVSHPVEAFKKEGETVLLQPGEILGMPVNPSLRPLLGYVLGKYRVWYMCQGLKDTGNVQPMFDYEILAEKGAKPSKKLPPPVNAQIDFDFENWVDESQSLEVETRDSAEYTASEIPIE